MSVKLNSENSEYWENNSSAALINYRVTTLVTGWNLQVSVVAGIKKAEKRPTPLFLNRNSLLQYKKDINF